MPSTSPQNQDFTGAARRHYADAVYLHDDGRLPNADHHYGFAVECALKSVLLTFLNATLAGNGKPSTSGPEGTKQYGHLPGLWADVRILLRGRSGSALMTALNAAEPFGTWDVTHHYHGNPPLSATIMSERKTAAHLILALHEQALINGVLQ
ncbi:hypothetical protein ACFYSC_06830 [Streptosporangium sp. NPDC004379]|uniref:hypothetical protein n=1 Tax=Streptosporangium sp. NPDC004379 TaxID=3366189 RepID=UPI0036CE7007